MDSLWQDLRYAVRTLVKSPAFTAVAVLTLAVGIGANTAIFSAVDAVLLEPLPFPQSDRLVEISTVSFKGTAIAVSYPDLLDLRTLTRDFAGVAGAAEQRYALTGAGDPRDVQASAVTANYFDVFGVRPEIGRAFTAADRRAPVAIISHALWATNFGGTPAVLGKPIALDGRSYTVVGVMPAGFMADEGTDLWTPVGAVFAQTPEAETNRDFVMWTTVARLAPGASLAQARGDLAALAGRLNTADAGPGASAGAGARSASGGPPPGPLDVGFSATRLRDAVIGDVRRPLFILSAAVVLVLLIACANAANLLLARATARRREMAVRRAMGAGRWRLVRQLLTESTLLSLAAGAVGVLFSAWGLGALASLWPRSLVRAGGVHLDATVLLFTFGLALVTGIAFGLVPAWRTTAPEVEGTLREESAGTTGARRQRLQGGLVAGEVTLALVLLVGAGLLVKSLVQLDAVNPGYDARDVIAAEVRLSPARYADSTSQHQFFDRVLATLAARPDVAGAALASSAPLAGEYEMFGFDPRSVRPDAGQQMMIFRQSEVSPDYFRTFRIPIRRGRAFTDADRAGAVPVAIMNRAATDELWPGEDPIGRQIELRHPGGADRRQEEAFTVVGVIDNLRSTRLDQQPHAEVYLSAAQSGYEPSMWIVARSAQGRPLELAGAIKDAVRRADAGQPISEIATLSALADRLTAARRFNTTLLTVFALLAVALALAGIYGVTSYAVTQRTRELGIRLALGAGPRQVVRLLVRENFVRVGVGVGLGLVAAFAVTRVLAAMLYDVAPWDPMTFVTTAVVLVLVALAATWWPARRATRVDPMVALRYE